MSLILYIEYIMNCSFSTKEKISPLSTLPPDIWDYVLTYVPFKFTRQDIESVFSFLIFLYRRRQRSNETSKCSVILSKDDPLSLSLSLCAQCIRARRIVLNHTECLNNISPYKNQDKMSDARILYTTTRATNKRTF